MVLPRKIALLNKRFINRVMVRLAPRVPGLAVLHHRGRTSGRRYAIPINVFIRGERYLFALTYGPDTDWLKNVRAAGRCTLIHRGRAIALHQPRVFRDEQRSQVPAPVRLVLGRIGADQFLEMRVAPAGPPAA